MEDQVDEPEPVVEDDGEGGSQDENSQDEEYGVQ